MKEMFSDIIDFLCALIVPVAMICIVLVAAYVSNKKPTHTTKYSNIDNTINCNIMQFDRKGCANLINCEDGNTYLCVTNIKMYVDK